MRKILTRLIDWLYGWLEKPDDEIYVTERYKRVDHNRNEWVEVTQQFRLTGVMGLHLLGVPKSGHGMQL